ncbi:transcription initiation factor TFIID subunit A-domain-containing protein [Cryomyces antarcticus]
MNDSGSAAQQGHQGPSQQQSGYNGLVRPEQIATFPHLSPQQKASFEKGCQGLWENIRNFPPEHQNHQRARQKLVDLTQRIQNDLKDYMATQRAQAGNSRPQSQGHGQGQPAQQAQVGQQQPRPGQPTQSQLSPAQTQQLMTHVQTFPYIYPAGMQAGTPEGEKFLNEAKGRYLKMLTRQETANQQLKVVGARIEQANSQGQEAQVQELMRARAVIEQTHRESKQQVENFRRSMMTKQEQNQQQSVNQANPNGNVPQQFQQSGLGQQNRQSHQSQMLGQPANTGMEAPQNQNSVGGRTSSSPANSGMIQQHQAPPSHLQTSQSQGGPPMQTGQIPNTARPQLNPQQQAQHSQMQHNSPQTQGQPSNFQGPPQPLSHQAAMSAAARTYSEQQRVTPQAGINTSRTQPQNGNLGQQTNNNPKMPIPKQLNIPQPQPVAMGPARPTMSGPSNGAVGMMGQPAINRAPHFVLEGDGDRVLSKKKLDELYRQVTGGADAEGLNPEVEESILQMADDFVDNVITAACRLAKLRSSSTLDIHDIQLILERNYNIRVPGYASDEVRTARKFQPAPGWTQKMNAVQATKITGVTKDS